LADRSVPGQPLASVVLTVQRVIRAKPERLFDAWTEPEQLKKWRGPASVTCVAAEVDLTVGGQYRIANRFPDGKILWITGVFEVIERPNRLIYTWQLSPEDPPERVSISFLAQGDDTKVIVVHERICDVATRDLHERGWLGCLAGLAEFLTGQTPEDKDGVLGRPASTNTKVQSMAAHVSGLMALQRLEIMRRNCNYE
jgi:uncharacterized protein YndB with AHSA1/START domain